MQVGTIYGATFEARFGTTTVDLDLTIDNQTERTTYAIADGVDEGLALQVKAALTGWLAIEGNEVIEIAQDLATKKAAVMRSASEKAGALREMIAGTDSKERAIAWVLKMAFAQSWFVNEGTTDPALQSLNSTAQEGFGIEAGITGEDAIVLRDRSIEKAKAFFLALQNVEGIERHAENLTEAATTIEEVDAVAALVSTLGASALSQLQQISE